MTACFCGAGCDVSRSDFLAVQLLQVIIGSLPIRIVLPGSSSVAVRKACRAVPRCAVLLGCLPAKLPLEFGNDAMRKALWDFLA